MDNEMLDENIKSFERILGNLRDYVTELHGRVAKINTEIAGIDDDICALEIIRDYHSKMLRKEKPKARDDSNGQ